MEPKDIKEIKTIIDLMKKNDLSVFEIEKEGFRIKLQRGSSGQAAAVAPLPTAVPPKASPSAHRSCIWFAQGDRKCSAKGNCLPHGGHVLSCWVAGRLAFC